mmetsp:Transcript_57838/g.154628  ORF Transcript_57838/g.154628 Transcript_57838/m.154628 type:complete len:201 (-) Transcript_57838:199-801(-)
MATAQSAAGRTAWRPISCTETACSRPWSRPPSSGSKLSGTTRTPRHRPPPRWAGRRQPRCPRRRAATPLCCRRRSREPRRAAASGTGARDRAGPASAVQTRPRRPPRPAPPAAPAATELRRTASTARAGDRPRLPRAASAAASRGRCAWAAGVAGSFSGRSAARALAIKGQEHPTSLRQVSYSVAGRRSICTEQRLARTR